MLVQDVIDFFDSLASGWDETIQIDEKIVDEVLNSANVKEDAIVLDVGCGTGVLIPYILEKGAKKVTGIDISPNMARIAAEKNKSEKVEIICGDASSKGYDHRFDSIIVYNAYTHFYDPELLVEKLCHYLKKDGVLCIAHSPGYENVNSMHEKYSHVTNLLPEMEEMKAIFERYVKIKDLVDEKDLFLISGIKY